MKKMKKRYITLVEMMIVMFLIAMITGVIAYNYTGSLDEGKAFKTKTGMEKIRTILDLHLATHPDDQQNISQKWIDIVESSPLVKNKGKDIIKDGWGGDYTVSMNEDGTPDVTSKRYNDYQASKGQGGLFNK